MRNKKLMIFGALAIGGLIATAVTTTWGSFKAAKVIQEKQPETKKEAAKLVWKYYIPAGIAVGTTIIADICFYRIGMKEIAALTASVSYLTANRSKLEKKLREAVGEEKYKEIEKDVQKEIISEKIRVEEALKDKKDGRIEGATTHPDSTRMVAEETGCGDTLFYDGWSGRFFRSSIEEVLDGIKRFNDIFHSEVKLPDGTTIKGCPVSWNDFYDCMHIAQTIQGDEFGYPANEDWIDLDSDLIKPDDGIVLVTEADIMTGLRDIGEDIYMIKPAVSPMNCYEDL